MTAFTCASQFAFGSLLLVQTLPKYVPPDYETLVINIDIDCDLYYSASFVLNALSEYVRPGTFIYAQAHSYI